MIICKCLAFSISAFAAGNGHSLIWSSSGQRTRELQKDICCMSIVMMILSVKNAAIC